MGLTNTASQAEMIFFLSQLCEGTFNNVCLTFKAHVVTFKVWSQPAWKLKTGEILQVISVKEMGEC